MNKLGILAAALLVGCATPPYIAEMPATESFGSRRPATTGRVPIPMELGTELEGQRTFGAPYRLPGQSTWLSSFVVSARRSLFRDSDPFAEGGLAAKGQASYGHEAGDSGMTWRAAAIAWHNGALVDRSSGEQWLLLSQRGVLSRWWMLVQEPEVLPGGETRGEPRARAMVFAATYHDTTGNGVLDDRDACVAVLTGGDGRDPRPVTPEDAQLQDAFYFAAEDSLAFNLRLDVDGDGRFEQDDPVRLYVLPLDGSATMARPWIGGGLEQQVEQLYGR